MKKKEIIVRQAQRILELEAQIAEQPAHAVIVKQKFYFDTISAMKFVRDVMPETRLVHVREIVAAVLELATRGEWQFRDKPLTEEDFAEIRKGILDNAAARQKIAG
jgi:hypothetical protein